MPKGIRKTVNPGDVIGDYIVLKSDDNFLFKVRCTSPYGHEATLSKQVLLRAKTGCKECAQIAEEAELVGTIMGGVIIVAIVREEDKYGRRIVTIRCPICGYESNMGLSALRNNHKNNRKKKCAGCKDAMFAAATHSPLVLSEEQAAECIRMAKKGVHSVLRNATAADKVIDDIVGEAMVVLLAKGDTVKPEVAHAIAFTIAANIAKLTFEPPKMKFIEPPKAEEESEEYADVFDDLKVDKAEPTDENELQKCALEIALSPDEINWLLEYQSMRGAKSKKQKARFAELVDRVRDAHSAIVAAVTEEGADDVNAIAA